MKIKGVRSYEEFWVMLPIKSLIFILWSFLALISLNHLYRFWDGLLFSTFFLGVLGWITIFITLVYLSKQFIKQSLLIFLIFFCIGYFLGPYLEPPGDPLHHLKRAYEACDKRSNQIEYPRKNEGLWHYSMSSNLLCSVKESTSPEVILRRIDILHGVYWGILTVGLFILSKSVGLPAHWAFLSCLIAFLFFGTNRFSYFSYYSLAPSFISLLIYWLWTAAYFFKKNWKDILYGLLLAMISLPILIVNHMQEAVFMAFIASIWLFCNLHERIWRWLTHSQIWLKTGYFLILFVFLFVLPQFEFFQKFLAQGFEKNLWNHNQQVVFYWQGFHVMGKIWSYRVNDTLGIMSTITVLLCVAFFWPRIIRINGKKKIRILILGILPFIGYCIPFFNFCWLSNVMIPEYYRLCYCAMFWITIAYFLYGLEGRFFIYWKKVKSIVFNRFVGTTKRLSFRAKYFMICLVIIIMISSIRSGPVYGKLDFILLETRPWWNEWRPMIEELMKNKGKPLYSDRQTNQVLHGVFYYPINGGFYEHSRRSIINIRSMGVKNADHSYRCIINLHGYTPSWVPKETGHWQWDLANTSLYYQYNGISGEELKDILKENPPKNCEVYY